MVSFDSEAITRVLVSAHVIPYIHVPDLRIGPIPLHPFGLLVATGVLVGTWLTIWRARKLGYDVDLLNSFITWMLVTGFIGAHVFDLIFYNPEELIARPWSLLMLWEGLSSFGGFLGALIGVFFWKFFEWAPTGPSRGSRRVFLHFYRRKTPLLLLPFADIVLSVFPVAWVFGRAGCSVVHDHPGAMAEPGAWFAVQWPSRAPDPTASFQLIYGDTLRYDLGLLEWLFSVVFAALVVFSWRKKLQTGTYVVVAALVYSPVRFALDYLRITEGPAADLRYGTLTFAQWMCVALFSFGLVFAWLLHEHRARGYDPARL